MTGSQPAVFKEVEAKADEVRGRQVKEQLFSEKMTYLEQKIYKLKG